MNLLGKLFSFLLFLLTTQLFGQLSLQSNLEIYENDITQLKSEEEQFARDEFLVSVRLYEFDSNYLEPWIDGITHLRAFGVDFTKNERSDGLYQYVDDSRLDDFVSFCIRKKLKVVWTLNVTSFTVEEEMNFIRELANKGLDFSGFQYGGEFFLPKYARADKNSKGVVERIRMDGEYNDYLDLLDLWLPAMRAEYPLEDYEHIIVAASVSNESGKAERYRATFNDKVFNYVLSRPDLKGKVSFSYHLYAGEMRFDNKGEEVVRLPEKISWSFINDIPAGSRWVVTESGYYMDAPTPQRLAEAREFYSQQSLHLGPDALMGIHTLVKERNKFHPMPLYDQGGITVIGENFKSWFDDAPPPQESPSGDDQVDEVPVDQEDNLDKAPEKTPTLVKIYPEYSGWFQWIHFSHSLTFSNGKSYNRSYWFSSPDFSIDDLGKPISYFKKVVKSK